MASEQKYGLNKEARLAAERAATGREVSAVLLQPDFPYNTQPFDPLFFGLNEAVSPADPPA